MPSESYKKAQERSRARTAAKREEPLIRSAADFAREMARREVELDTGTASKLRQQDNEIRRKMGLLAR